MNPLHILLIDLDSPCPTEHCLRLAEMMQHSLPVGEMRLQTTTMFPSTPTAATPDLILLRPSCEEPTATRTVRPVTGPSRSGLVEAV